MLVDVNSITAKPEKNLISAADVGEAGSLCDGGCIDRLEYHKGRYLPTRLSVACVIAFSTKK